MVKTYESVVVLPEMSGAKLTMGHILLGSTYDVGLYDPPRFVDAFNPWLTDPSVLGKSENEDISVQVSGHINAGQLIAGQLIARTHNRADT